MTVIYSGPLFDGRAPAIVKSYLDRIEVAVTDRGQSMVRTLQRQSFRYVSGPPTGKAGNAVRTRAEGDHHVVTDSGIVYGHWLEGSGSRNATTRFKGYWIFRRTGNTLDARASAIAQPFVSAMCEALS